MDTSCAQHNNQLAAFRSAALWPITQNAVGDHICHFVIDRLLFIFQPSHRAVKEALQHTGPAQNVDQQRHLVLRRVPNPEQIHQSGTTVMWTDRLSTFVQTLCVSRPFPLIKAELKKLFTSKSVTTRLQSPLFYSRLQKVAVLYVFLSWPLPALI